MRYRKLTPAGDYSAGHGAADWLVDTPAAVAQAVGTRIRLLTGEWFLDTQEGTPWRTQILGHNPQRTADLVLRARVLGTTGLTGIVAFESSLTAARQYGLAVTVTTVYDAGAPPVSVTVTG